MKTTRILNHLAFDTGELRLRWRFNLSRLIKEGSACALREKKSCVGGWIDGRTRTRRGKLDRCHRSSVENARYGQCIGIDRDGCRVWSKSGCPSNCACKQFWSLWTMHDCNFRMHVGASVAALEWVTLEGWVMIPAPYSWKSEGRGEGRRVVGVWYSPNASSNYPVWQNPFWVLRSYSFRMHPPPLIAWNCDADGWCMWWFQTCMCFGGGSNPETRSNQIWDSRAIDTYTV